MHPIDGNMVREAVSKFLIPLQTTRIIKHEAFEELFDAIKVLAEAWKGHDLVSKSLLNEIYVTMGILRNEAPYFKENSAILEGMANRLQLIFDLILLGETPEDRTPGKPRIR